MDYLIEITKAKEEIRSAECFFNWTISPHHTDLAIKALNIANSKLDLLISLSKLNSFIEEPKDIQQEELNIKSIFRRVTTWISIKIY